MLPFGEFRWRSGLDKGEAMMDDVGVKRAASLVTADVPLPRLACVDPDDVDDAEMKDEAEDDDDCMR